MHKFLDGHVETFVIEKHNDARGELGVIESFFKDFEIKRCFWITGVPNNTYRGEHGHQNSTQILIPISGKIEILCKTSNGNSWSTTLGSDLGLIIKPNTWIQMKFNNPNEVLLVLTDTSYSEDQVFTEFNNK